MPLQKWITELNAATTELDIVRVVSRFVREVRRTSTVPDQCLPNPPGTLADIKRAASALTRCRLDSTATADREAYQNLLIFFSIAVDRIDMLEARGILVPLMNSLGLGTRGGMPAPC